MEMLRIAPQRDGDTWAPPRLSLRALPRSRLSFDDPDWTAVWAFGSRGLRRVTAAGRFDRVGSPFGLIGLFFG